MQLSADGVWADDSHRLSELIQADPAELFSQLSLSMPARTSPTPLARDFERAERITWAVIEREIESGPWFDGGAAHDMAAALPEGASFVVGNSLAVRNLDQFGAPSARYVFAHANRGVSGIDGNLSTAFGVGHVRRGGPLAALVGDVTFYHDMNGLLAARRCGVPATIVLVNNNGGGIFRQLPVNAPSNEPAFTQHFLTPHDLEFEHAARLYGLNYVRADDRAGFNRAFRAGIAQRERATLIEVRTDSAADLRRRNQIAAAVHAAVRQEK
jgi:2-succinyl-5-enolpyruvyl-6-hydroxy-3-cyclohexene-1-carboxylate synthase